jgi:hypothetical protein
VTAGHDAVFQALATDFQGFEQVREGGCRHGAITPGSLLFVGASLLAMDVNNNAGYLTPRGVLGSFASKLAPTEASGFGCYYCSIEIYPQ